MYNFLVFSLATYLALVCLWHCLTLFFILLSYISKRTCWEKGSQFAPPSRVWEDYYSVLKEHPWWEALAKLFWFALLSRYFPYCKKHEETKKFYSLKRFRKQQERKTQWNNIIHPSRYLSYKCSSSDASKVFGDCCHESGKIKKHARSDFSSRWERSHSTLVSNKQC